ncbi:MAG: hypothetical protein ACLFWH_05540 [Actinomycetota bacterium]
MTVTTLHEVEESLRALDPDTLREMVYQTARSHINVCQLTSQVGGCAHISDDETRDRVEAMSVGELAAVLAPTAWISIDLHQRLGG